MVRYAEEIWVHVLIFQNKKKKIQSATSSSVNGPFFIIWMGLNNKALIRSCVGYFNHFLYYVVTL